MWRVLKNMYAKVESSVVVNAKRGEWFELHTGVRQGCILSPTLFAIFIDGLARAVKALNLGAQVGPQPGPRKSQRLAELRSKKLKHGLAVTQQSMVHVSLLLFADDIVLVTSSGAHLQEMLDTVHQYSRQYRFEFNAKKSNVMVFKSSGKQQREVSLMRLGDCVLEEKTSYKYLGLEIEQDWKWQQTKARMLEKARKRMATVCARTSAAKNLGEGSSAFVGSVGVAVVGVLL
jgi:hypothetical protein